MASPSSRPRTEQLGVGPGVGLQALDVEVLILECMRELVHQRSPRGDIEVVRLVALYRDRLRRGVVVRDEEVRGEVVLLFDDVGIVLGQGERAEQRLGVLGILAVLVGELRFVGPHSLVPSLVGEELGLDRALEVETALRFDELGERLHACVPFHVVATERTENEVPAGRDHDEHDEQNGHQPTVTAAPWGRRRIPRLAHRASVPAEPVGTGN